MLWVRHYRWICALGLYLIGRQRPGFNFFMRNEYTGVIGNFEVTISSTSPLDVSVVVNACWSVPDMLILLAWSEWFIVCSLECCKAPWIVLKE